MTELVWNICQISGLYSAIVSSMKRFSTKCCWSHILTLHLLVLSQSLEAGVQGCQIALVATTSSAVGGGGPGGPIDGVPTRGLSLNFFNADSRKMPSLTCVLSAGGVYSHTGRHPEQQQRHVTLSVFHLCPDADDKLILRTNSIILNNRRRWQAHNKNTSMNELFTFFGARSAGRRPCRAKMPLHYETPEPGAARADPVTDGNRILVHVFLGSRQAEADRRHWSLKCHIFLLLAAGCRFSRSFHPQSLITTV